jgi:hypothetical protein
VFPPTVRTFSEVLPTTGRAVSRESTSRASEGVRKPSTCLFCGRSTSCGRDDSEETVTPGGVPTPAVAIADNGRGLDGETVPEEERVRESKVELASADAVITP